MSKAALTASLALWRRRHRWNERMRARARRRGNEKAARRYGTRLAHCAEMIRRRKRQLEQLAARKSVRQRTVDHAATFIGTVEYPAGSNRGPKITGWQEMFGFDGGGVPWCGTFAGAMLVWGGVQGVSSRIAAVAFIEDDARARRRPFRGWTQNPASVLPGDLVVIGGRGVHVELVEKVHADGSVTTIGGNTSPGREGSQANGGGVWRRERSRIEIHGFALVNYPG